MRTSLAILLLGLVPLASAQPLRRWGFGLPTRWGFGLVAAAGLVTLGHAAGMPREVGLALPVLAALLGAALGARLTYRPMARAAHAARAGAAPGGPLATALAFALVGSPLLLWTLATPVSWQEAVVVGFAKVRALAEWRPVEALPFPAWPNLGPLAWMLGREVSGEEPIGRLVFPLLHLAWLGMALELLPRPLPRAAAAVPLAAWLLLDPAAVAAGMLGPAVASLAGMAAVALLLSVEGAAEPGPRGAAAAYLGAFLAAATGLVSLQGPWAGLPLLGAWALWRALAVGPGRPAAWRELVGPLVLYGTLASAWPLVLLARGLPLDSLLGELTGATPRQLAALPDHGPKVLWLLVTHLGNRALQLGPAAALAAWAAWRVPGLRRSLGFLALAVLLNGLLATLSLLLTPVGEAWPGDGRLACLLSLAEPAWVLMLALSAVGLLGPAESEQAPPR